MLVLEMKVIIRYNILFGVFAVRAATHDHTRAWQTLIPGGGGVLYSFHTYVGSGYFGRSKF